MTWTYGRWGLLLFFLILTLLFFFNKWGYSNIEKDTLLVLFVVGTLASLILEAVARGRP